jgi:hypothetical protein|tara:strand:- start:526 stop:1017 length:492 start_codon:yes stop_codon:yes gene_type:complete
MVQVAEYPDTVNKRTKLTPVVYKSILEAVSQGNWIDTAAQSVGIDRRVIHRWIQIGRGDHPTRKPVEPFVTFSQEIETALAKAEQSLVKDLRKEADWRAKAWLLERGPSRDRWSQNVTISAQLAPAASILDALRNRAAATEEGEEVQPLQILEAKEDSDAKSR